MTTLIFPSSHSAAYGYYQQAMMNGEDVVCASSMAYDDTAYLYKTWFRLPSIYDEDFHDELWSEIFNRDIDKIYCPSTQIYEFLDTLLDLCGAKLIGKSPAIVQAEYYKDLIKQAEKSLEFINTVVDTKLNNRQIAALLKQTANIYGESHMSKLLAIMAIFSDTPKGSVIEIGTLLGKTAVLMSTLARWNHIGKVIAIDSWCPSPQKESSQSIQKIADLWDWMAVYKGFLINKEEQFGEDWLDVFDWSSKGAYQCFVYQKDPIPGKVFSVLHIDANHDYNQVKQDYDLWRPHVLPGGWLILDDYVWSHGDGPKRVGDAALENENIERAFTCGGALFMKFAEAA